MQIRFSNHRLVKISMAYLYIKPEVKKYDTTAMTTAINEACAGNCYFVRGYFWCGKLAIFLLLGRVLPPSTGLLPNGKFRERGRAVNS